MLLFEEVLQQENKTLKTIQKQEAPLYQKKKVLEKVRQMFHLWQEMTLLQNNANPRRGV